MENIADRINKLIKDLGISKNAFGEKIGISSSLISQITTKKNNFRADILQKITSAYPQLNPIWLLNGIGVMWDVNLKLSNFPDDRNSSPEFQKLIDKHLGGLNEYRELIENTEAVPFHYWSKVDEMLKNNNPDLFELNEHIGLLLGFKDVIFTLEEKLLYKLGYSYSRFPKGSFDIHAYQINVTNALKEFERLKPAFDTMAAAILDFYRELKIQGISEIDFDAYSLNALK